jgi:hypothetical protein
MPRILSTLLSLSLVMTLVGSLQAQLLYEVKSPGGKTSHLFGTLHLMKSGHLKAHYPKVMEAYQAADKVVVETVIDSSKLPALGQMALLSEGELSDLFTPEEYEQIKEVMPQYSSYPMAMLKRFKPIQLLLMITMKQYQNLELPMQAASGTAVDQYFATAAKEHGQQVVALESLREQFHLLFNELSDSAQAEMLLETMDNPEEGQALAQQMARLYKNQALEDLGQLYQDHKEDFQNMSFLLEERNQRWMQKLPAILDDGNAFVAVGALHLPMEEGLLALLEAQGYEVTATKLR